jgi:hypothetical protein
VVGPLPECGSWNSLRDRAGFAAPAAGAEEPQSVLLEPSRSRRACADSGIGVQIMPGGIMKGSAVLLAGSRHREPP